MLELRIHGCDAGCVALGPSQKIDEAISRGTNPGHQTGPRSPTGGHHAKRSLKQGAACRQLVNVWRVNVLLAVTSQFRP